MRAGSGRCEALLDRLQHHVAHVRAGDARVGDRRPSYDPLVEGADDKGQTDDLAVPAGEPQTVRASAQVRAHDHHLAVLEAALATGRMLLQQHGVIAHDAMNRFGIEDTLTGGWPIATWERGDPPTAVGCPSVPSSVHQPANDGYKLGILGLVFEAARL